MTFLELCNAVRADANVQGTIATTVGQEHVYGNIVRWVEQAYNDIQADHDNWTFLQGQFTSTLNPGSRLLNLNTSGEIIEYIRGTLFEDSDQYHPSQKDWLSFNRHYPSGGDIQDGRPSIFAQIPETPTSIYFDKKTLVSRDYNFRAMRIPDTLTANTGVPVFPARFHRLIADWALESYAAFYNSPEIIKYREKISTKRYSRMEYELLPKNVFFTRPFV